MDDRAAIIGLSYLCFMADISDKKKKIIAALTEAHGIVSDACKMVNISRETFYKWKREDEKFSKQADEAGEVAIDYVESQLYKLIKEQNPAAIIFYMKTKGRTRGYIERYQVDQTITDNRIKVEVNNKVAEELARLN